MANVITGGLVGPTRSQSISSNMQAMSTGLQSFGNELARRREAQQERQRLAKETWLDEFRKELDTNYDSDITSLAQEDLDKVYEYFLMTNQGNVDAAMRDTARVYEGQMTSEQFQAKAGTDLLRGDLSRIEADMLIEGIDDATKANLQAQADELKAKIEQQETDYYRDTETTKPWESLGSGGDYESAYGRIFGTGRKGSQAISQGRQDLQKQILANEHAAYLNYLKENYDYNPEVAGPEAQPNYNEQALTMAGGSPPQMVPQGPSSVPGMQAYDRATNGQDPHHLAAVGEGEGIVNAEAMRHGGAEIVRRLNEQYPNPAANLAPDSVPVQAEGMPQQQPYMAPPQMAPAYPCGTNKGAPVRAEGYESPEMIASKQGYGFAQRPGTEDPRKPYNWGEAMQGLGEEMQAFTTPGMQGPQTFAPQAIGPGAQRLRQAPMMAEGYDGTHIDRSYRPYVRPADSKQPGYSPADRASGLYNEYYGFGEFAMNNPYQYPDYNPNIRIPVNAGGYRPPYLGQPYPPVHAGGRGPRMVPSYQEGYFGDQAQANYEQQQSYQQAKNGEAARERSGYQYSPSGGTPYRDPYGNYIGPVGTSQSTDLSSQELKELGYVRANSSSNVDETQYDVLRVNRGETGMGAETWIRKIEPEVDAVTGAAPQAPPIQGPEEASAEEPWQAKASTTPQVESGFYPPDNKPAEGGEEPPKEEDPPPVVKDEEDPLTKGEMAKMRRWVSRRPMTGAFNQTTASNFMNLFYPEGMDILDFMGDVYKAEELRQSGARVEIDKDRLQLAREAQEEAIDQFNRTLQLDRDKFTESKEHNEFLRKLQQNAADSNPEVINGLFKMAESFQSDLDALVEQEGNYAAGYELFVNKLMNSPGQLEAFEALYNQLYSELGILSTPISISDMPDVEKSKGWIDRIIKATPVIKHIFGDGVEGGITGDPATAASSDGTVQADPGYLPYGPTNATGYMIPGNNVDYLFGETEYGG